ncbi:hypothetical protein B0H19DRAFT_1271082 [Mycena capillaripes]|nr:hypothetical protein B0H19DRAFT_1271082 [Mycena capillaripes]
MAGTAGYNHYTPLSSRLVTQTPIRSFSVHAALIAVHRPRYRLWLVIHASASSSLQFTASPTADAKYLASAPASASSRRDSKIKGDVRSYAGRYGSLDLMRPTQTYTQSAKDCVGPGKPPTRREPFSFPEDRPSTISNATPCSVTTTRDQDAHQAQHHSMSIAVQRTKAAGAPEDCSRRPELHTAVELGSCFDAEFWGLSLTCFGATVAPERLPHHPTDYINTNTIYPCTIRVIVGCPWFFIVLELLIFVGMTIAMIISSTFYQSFLNEIPRNLC